jgi:hypothetical protein
MKWTMHEEVMDNAVTSAKLPLQMDVLAVYLENLGSR